MAGVGDDAEVLSSDSDGLAAGDDIGGTVSSRPSTTSASSDPEFFGSRATTTGIDFDIELAKRQSNENPVYYVQYAHARCCSILRNARERSVEASTADAAVLLRHPAEQALIRELLRLPEVLSDAAARRETHEVPKYCLEVAGLFSQFYRDCRVLTDDPEEARFSGARLALVDAVRLVLANTLGTLGIAAPETM